MGMTFNMGFTNIHKTSVLFSEEPNYYLWADNSDRKINFDGSNWNGRVILPYGVQRINFRCPNFNSPVNIPNTVINTARMFSANCIQFNQPITIPDGVTNTFEMFQGCSNFNSPVSIPYSVKNARFMFNGCTKFISSLNIDTEIPTVSYLFSDNSSDQTYKGKKFKNFIIGDNVKKTINWFGYFNYFPNNIVIGNNVISTGDMFSSMYDQPESIYIGNRVTYTQGMFKNCTSFNKPVTLPNKILNTYYMFCDCKVFNQPIIIPNTVTNVTYMFRNCNEFNQPLIIPNSVLYADDIVSNAFNYHQEIWFGDHCCPSNIVGTSNCKFNISGLWFNKVSNVSGTKISRPIDPSYDTQYGIFYTNGKMYISYNNLCQNLYINQRQNFNINALNTTFNNRITSSEFVFKIPESRTSVSQFFQSALSYINSKVILSNNTTNTASMFSSCTFFDKQIDLPDSILDSSHMFSNCGSYNQPTHIPMNLVNAFGMFSNCTNFNQPITILNQIYNANRMFSNCTNFNQPITILNQIHDASEMFSGCTNFNQPVDIEKLYEMSSMFTGTKYNQPLVIRANKNYKSLLNGARYFKSTIYIEDMNSFYESGNFQGIFGYNSGTNIYDTWSNNSFNCPVVIGNNITNIDDLLYLYRNFNSSLTIPSSVINCLGVFSNNKSPSHLNINSPNVSIRLLYARFSSQLNSIDQNSLNYGLYTFNASVTFGNAVTNYRSYFEKFQILNKPIIISDTAIDTSFMFYGCYNFNQPINIPDSVTNTSYMFDICNNFNSPVTIGNNVTNMFCMFSQCFNFNQPINIPDSVIDIGGMLSYCNNFNSPVTIGNNVTNTSNMFNNFIFFNSPVTIGNSVTDVSFMFYNCQNFNQPITIPDSVTNTYSMLYNCYKFNSTITVYAYNQIKKLSLSLPLNLSDPNTKKSIKIYGNNFNLYELRSPNNFDIFVEKSILLSTGNWNLNSYNISGANTGYIYFTIIGNSMYNTKYNIYIYNTL